MSSVTASRTYNPGDLIYSDEVFARVLPRDKKDDQCEFCFKSSDDLIFCEDCTAVKYCGKECQAKDLEDHKTECGILEKLRENPSEDFVRLLGRIIFKIKGKDWSEITKNVLGTVVSFEDVDSHYEEMTENPRNVLFYEGVKDSLRDYIGEENMPKDDDLIKIIGKVKFSSCSFVTTYPDDFYLGMDRFEHECIPNSNLEICNSTVKVWAMRKIEISEKITVTRRPMLTSALIRSPINVDSLEICRCSECSLPYGESVLTKIIDKTKAYDVIRLSEKVIDISQTLANMDMESDFRLRILVDKALDRQMGVLAPTNALHMKLLAVKAMRLEGTDLQKKVHLLDLEKHMKSVFGEYYLELHKIYKGLVVYNFKLSNILEGALYLKKAEELEKHQTKEEEEDD